MASLYILMQEYFAKATPLNGWECREDGSDSVMPWTGLKLLMVLKTDAQCMKQFFKKFKIQTSFKKSSMTS